MSFIVCPICLEGLHVHAEDQSAIPCGHVYHNSCIRRWITQGQQNCPQCRIPFKQYDIVRLHFATSETGCLAAELRQELKAVKARLHDAEASCAAVLEQSVAEQARLKRLLEAQTSAQHPQDFRHPGCDLKGLHDQRRIQVLREELRKTKGRLQETEAACASVVEQSILQQSRLSEALRQAQTVAATILEQSAEQSSKLQQNLHQTQNNACAVLEQTAAEQSRLHETLRQTQTSAASVLEQSVLEQSRLEEILRQVQVKPGCSYGRTCSSAEKEL